MLVTDDMDGGGVFLVECLRLTNDFRLCFLLEKRVLRRNRPPVDLLVVVDGKILFLDSPTPPLEGGGVGQSSSVDWRSLAVMSLSSPCSCVVVVVCCACC